MTLDVYDPCVTDQCLLSGYTSDVRYVRCNSNNSNIYIFEYSSKGVNCVILLFFILTKCNGVELLRIVSGTALFVFVLHVSVERFYRQIMVIKSITYTRIRRAEETEKVCRRCVCAPHVIRYDETISTKRVCCGAK